jgi:hypothetical protein
MAAPDLPSRKAQSLRPAPAAVFDPVVFLGQNAKVYLGVQRTTN